MNRIQFSARFANVSSATLAEFKEAAAEVMDIAKGEPGVLQYDWFINDNQTVCVVRETYQDSDALLAHVRTWVTPSPGSSSWAGDVSPKCSAIGPPSSGYHCRAQAFRLPDLLPGK